MESATAHSRLPASPPLRRLDGNVCPPLYCVWPHEVGCRGVGDLKNEAMTWVYWTVPKDEESCLAVAEAARAGAELRRRQLQSGLRR